jgi:hypothetical protein
MSNTHTPWCGLTAACLERNPACLLEQIPCLPSGTVVWVSTRRVVTESTLDVGRAELFPWIKPQQDDRVAERHRRLSHCAKVSLKRGQPCEQQRYAGED